MSEVNRSAFAGAARGGGGLRKSPLRLATDPVPVVSAGSSWRAADVLAGGGFRRSDLSPAQRRQVMISEYGEWLRSQTNRHGRPFQAETISAYRDAAVALSSWMTSVGLEADFTGCGTAALNRFFRAYLAAHSQGGTNTKQRNLRHLFSWLAIEYGQAQTSPALWLGTRNRGPVTGNGVWRMVKRRDARPVRGRPSGPACH